MQAACGFKPARMADGGRIQGPGTGTSDSIPMRVPVDSYVVPADSTRSINVSNGETALTPQQVKAVGTAALEAVRKVTHKPVKAAGFKSKFADGGLVASISAGFRRLAERGGMGSGNPQNLQARQDAGLTAAPVATPPQAAASKPVDPNNPAGIQFADGGAVTDDAPSSPAAAMADAAWRAAQGLGADANSPLGFGARRAGAITPATVTPATPTAQPAAPAAAPYAVGFTPGIDSQAANVQAAVAQPAAAPAAPAVPGTPVAGAPGVGKVIGPDGSVTYSNVVGDTGFAARGAPSAQNQLALNNIQARQDAGDQAAANKAQYDQEVADAAATNSRGGFNTGQPVSPRQALSAQLSRGKLTPQGAKAAEALLNNDVSQGQLGLASTKLSLEAPEIQAKTQQAATATQQAQAILGARMQYAKALQSGDPKAIEAAESNLRGQEGRWERNYPELYKTTALPATINPDGSRSPGGAIVTDARTGETRIIYGKDMQGPDGAPAIAEGSISTVNGKKAKFIGGKWVPQ